MTNGRDSACEEVMRKLSNSPIIKQPQRERHPSPMIDKQLCASELSPVSLFTCFFTELLVAVFTGIPSRSYRAHLQPARTWHDPV